MNVTRLFLVRHGATSGEKGTYYGWQDIPLSEEGQEQSGKVVERLHSQKIDAVFCSDLKRALYLGELIARSKGLLVQPDKRIRELNFGEWEGRRFSELNEKEQFRKWLANFTTKPIPGGESLAELVERSAEFLKEVKEQYSKKTVVIVAHLGVLRCLLMHLLQIEPHNFWSFNLDKTSVSIIEESGGKACLKLMNDICHLGGLNAHLD